MKSAMLYVVGVGPGDPELLTLKAIRVIEASDVIAAPDGGVAASIASAYIQNKRYLQIEIPMTENRSVRQSAHEAAAKQIEGCLQKGSTVAYLTLGDPSLYASCGYLMEIVGRQYPVEVVPGIPAMCAAAAVLRVPIAAGREPLAILPGYKEGEPLPADKSIVVMKAGKSLKALQAACGVREAYYACNIGLTKESAGRLDGADVEAGHYFTTVIIPKDKSASSNK